MSHRFQPGMLLALPIALLLAACATPTTPRTDYVPMMDSPPGAEPPPGSRLLDANATIEQMKQWFASHTPPGYDQPLTLLHAALPAYPADALNEGVTGSVAVRFTVAEDGHVESAVAVRSPDPRLSEASVTAILQWRFAPITKGGKPARETFLETFPFRL